MRIPAVDGMLAETLSRGEMSSDELIVNLDVVLFQDPVFEAVVRLGVQKTSKTEVLPVNPGRVISISSPTDTFILGANDNVTVVSLLTPILVEKETDVDGTKSPTGCKLSIVVSATGPATAFVCILYTVDNLRTPSAATLSPADSGSDTDWIEPASRILAAVNDRMLAEGAQDADEKLDEAESWKRSIEGDVKPGNFTETASPTSMTICAAKVNLTSVAVSALAFGEKLKAGVERKEPTDWVWVTDEARTGPLRAFVSTVILGSSVFTPFRGRMIPMLLGTVSTYS
jgi:hypothetical protein